MSGRREAGARLAILLPYFRCRKRSNRKLRAGGEKRIAVNIINGMRPQTIGRALGIGIRVAGRVAGQRLAGPVQPVPAPAPAGQAAATGRAAAIGQTAGRTTAQAGRGVANGLGGFLRPFRRVGGILWLEVTGVFFLLPVIVFAPKMWQTRASWQQGPDHRTFVASAIVVVVFLYLGITSFWRAHRRSAAR